MATKEKNVWILLLFILSGIVIGGLLGLSYGQNFGLSTPIQLDLSVVQLSFGLMFKINIASIVGMVIAIVIYRKV